MFRISTEVIGAELLLLGGDERRSADVVTAPIPT
jgi:hypothetical protein